MEPAGWVSPRPPTGNELLFTGFPSGSSVLTLYAIGVDGTGLRQVGAEATMAASGERAFHQPQISSDGSTLHYWNWEKSGDAESSFMHTRDLDTGEETRVRYGPGHFGVDVRLSPDSTMVLYEGYGGAQAGAGVEGSGNETQAYAQPVDGSRPATPVGPIYANGRTGFDFSPDGSQVILVANSGAGGAMETSITDMATETTTTVLPGIEELPSWQRLAVPAQ